ncbi:MAG: M28 family peptidase [Anaeromyxobacter sp.]
MRLARVAAAPLLLAAACATVRPPPGELSPDPARLRADVTWLADPARTGRGIGTPGLAAAADWLEARYRALGLAPAFGADYQQRFEVPWRARLGAPNALALAGKPVELSKGFVPFGFSDDGKVEAELVFAGYGITAPALGYDDYAGLDVKGKIVVVAQDFPREQDPASPFRDPKNFALGDWRQKAITAREHGAAALLAVRDDWHHPAADDLPAWSEATGSRGGVLAARVTLAALREAGVDVAALAAPIGADAKPHSKALGVKAVLEITVVHEKTTSSNVAAVMAGADPALAGECVVIGAHFDHLGFGGETSLAPTQIGQVHPGADDNASGTSAVLELARGFKAGPPLRRTLLFVNFTGEETGLLGSTHFVKELPAACPAEKIQLMVNLDMVGRPQGGKVYVQGVDTAKGLRERVRALAERAPAVPLKLVWDGEGYAPSDSTAFYSKGIPVLYFFTGAHLDYHRPSDTADKIDGKATAEVVRYAGRVARDLADAQEKLAVVRVEPPKEGVVGRGGGGRSGGAFLGAVPEFGERPDPGVLLSGVRPGSPAEGAGLAAGDVIVRIGATKVQNLQDLAYALKANRPGETVEVEFLRAGVRKVVPVKLVERK